METLLKQVDCLPLEDLFVLNNVLLNNFGLLLELKKYDFVKQLIAVSNKIMARTHDFQKKPIVNLLTWKHHLFVEKDYAKAKKSYDAAILFAQLTENINLRENLEKEWQKDSQNGT